MKLPLSYITNMDIQVMIRPTPVLHCTIYSKPLKQTYIKGNSHDVYYR